MEHYFQQPTTLSESIVAEAAGPKNSSAGGFDCNICLESVGDPVVTFCGHLTVGLAFIGGSTPKRLRVKILSSNLGALYAKLKSRTKP